MAELLPDSWRLDELLQPESSQPTCHGTVKQRKKPVTDILTWVKCFSVMAAVMTAKHPDRAPGLFAYNKSIVRASQVFEGPTWVSYDIQFRRKAALSRSFNWGEIDTALYNETFTGRAKARGHCRVCFSEAHLEKACPLAMPEPSQWSNAPMSQTSSSHFSYPQYPGNRPSPRYSMTNRPVQHRAVEVCGLFNKGECRFKDCKFAHICSLCRTGPHPASRCSGQIARGPGGR